MREAKKIGARLAAARKERGLSQGEVAARLSVSRARVCAVEGSADILISTLRRYAKAIGLQEEEVGQLLEGVTG